MTADPILDPVDNLINNKDAHEIHVHKKMFERMTEDCNARGHGAIDVLDPAETPVVEGPLGSMKQLGRYVPPGKIASTPVYSHGKHADDVYVSSDGSTADGYTLGKKP